MTGETEASDTSIGPPRRWSRRSLLGTGAVGLVVGACGTEIGNVLAGGSSSGGSSTPPDVDLMQEHGVLKRILLIYQNALLRLGGGEEPVAAAVHDGALIIHDFIEGFHEPLEEGYVFPRVRQAGPQFAQTVDTLLVQHARGRERTQIILAGSNSRALSSAGDRKDVSTAMADFIRMYAPHEAREDTVVFPAFRSLLGADELNDLAENFADLQHQQFGSGGFSTMVERVASIEKELGIYDLEQFTPAPITP